MSLTSYWNWFFFIAWQMRWLKNKELWSCSTDPRLLTKAIQHAVDANLLAEVPGPRSCPLLPLHPTGSRQRRNWRGSTVRLLGTSYFVKMFSAMPKGCKDLLQKKSHTKKTYCDVKIIILKENRKIIKEDGRLDFLKFRTSFFRKKQFCGTRLFLEKTFLNKNFSKK